MNWLRIVPSPALIHLSAVEVAVSKAPPDRKRAAAQIGAMPSIKTACGIEYDPQVAVSVEGDATPHCPICTAI